MSLITVCDTCCLNCTKEKCKIWPLECNKGVRGKCGLDDPCKAFTSKPESELIKEVPENE